MTKIFVTPAEGVLVRHENGKRLDPIGETVDRSAYWLRRERDGDVTISAAGEVIDGEVLKAELEIPDNVLVPGKYLELSADSVAADAVAPDVPAAPEAKAKKTNKA